jgi:hypothetical protein
MKRALILLLLIAIPAAAAQEKWWEAYNRGIKAVNSKNYADGAEAARPMVVAQKPSAPVVRGAAVSTSTPTAPAPAHPATEGGAAPLNVPQNAPLSVATTTTVAPPPCPVETAAVAPVIEAKPEPLSQAVKPVLVATVTHPPKSRSVQLESAYRAFAVGDLATSERALTSMVGSVPSTEAFLLRGCARYTRAMLSRTPDKLLASARNDFKAALKLNRALRLDRSAFSPKLIACFEEVRRSGV